MKTRTKILAASAVVVVGVAALAGPGLAQRAQRGAMGMMGGMMGGLGAEQLVREVDTDRDGRITQAELDAAVNARFARFDADQNGRLSLDEFTALWADLTRPVAVRAFQFLDPNGDASVTKAEVDERFGGLVQRLDRNGDGALSMQDRGHHRANDRGGRGEQPEPRRDPAPRNPT